MTSGDVFDNQGWVVGGGWWVVGGGGCWCGCGCECGCGGLYQCQRDRPCPCYLAAVYDSQITEYAKPMFVAMLCMWIRGWSILWWCVAPTSWARTANSPSTEGKNPSHLASRQQGVAADCGCNFWSRASLKVLPSRVREGRVGLGRNSAYRIPREEPAEHVGARGKHFREAVGTAVKVA